MQKIILSLLLLTGSIITASAQKTKTKTKATLSDTTNHWLIRAHGTSGVGDRYDHNTIHNDGITFLGTWEAKVQSYGLDFGRTFGKNNNFYVMTGIGMMETGWHGTWGYNYVDGNTPDVIEYILTGRAGENFTHVAVPIKAGMKAGWFFSEVSLTGTYMTKWSASQADWVDGQWKNIPTAADHDPRVKHLGLMAGLTLGVNAPITKHIRLQLGVDAKASVRNAFKVPEDPGYYAGGAFIGYVNASAFAGIMYQF